jgi:mono/diheme cytochrome c family protein
LTEIPEHLLERSRSRRAALGLLKDGEAASSAAPVKASDASPAASAAAPAAKAAPATAPEPVKAPEPLKPYVAAALTRKKIPYWAVPVLLFLPIWLVLYVGTLQRPAGELAGLLAEGQELYAANCAGCHGAGGGGGSGPALNNGDVLATFPDPADHIWWIVNGSAAVAPGDTYGSADRPGGARVSKGGMPGWAGTMTAREILAVTYYERITHGGHTEADEIAIHDLAESADLPESYEAGTTADAIAEQLAPFVGEGGAAG